MLSDRGPQFSSELVAEICRRFGVRKAFSSAYYPQGDGKAERFMRTMNNSLSILAGRSHSLWDRYVKRVQLGYNASSNAATGISPFILNTGRCPRLPGQGEIPDVEAPADVLEVINEAVKAARENLHHYHERMKTAFDKTRKDVQLDEGAWVVVQLSDYERNKAECRKLAPRWSDPCQVVSRLSNGVTYHVRREDGKVEAVHISKMLPLSRGLTQILERCEEEAVRPEMPEHMHSSRSWQYTGTPMCTGSDEDEIEEVISWSAVEQPPAGPTLDEAAPRIACAAPKELWRVVVRRVSTTGHGSRCPQTQVGVLRGWTRRRW